MDHHYKRLIGFAVLDHITPPTFNRWCTAVNCRVVKDPVFQDWIEFRCESLRRRFEEMWFFIKQINPAVVVEYNVYSGLGENAAWYGGVEFHRLLPFMDAFWDERAPRQPGFDRGMMLHRVHAMKLGQASRCVVFGWNEGRNAEEQRLSVSENLAFNQGHVSGFGYNLAFARGAYPEVDEMIAFRKSHPLLYDGATSAADVALYESARSLALNVVDPHYAEVMAFGSLLAGHVPFDLLTELADEALKRYALLVLPCIECMSDDEAETVVRYVNAGGSVVFTDKTGWFDVDHRRRAAPALERLLSPTERGDQRHTYGQGRVAFIHDLIPRQPFRHETSDSQIDTKYWHLPKNLGRFLAAVQWAGGTGLRVQITAPTGVAAEVRRTTDGRTLVHLVNYDLKKTATGVWLAVRGKRPSLVTLLTPWQTRHAKLKPVKFGGGVRVKVGALRRYAVIELHPEGE